MGIRKHIGWVLGLLFAVFALYGQFLWNPIVFDDLPLFTADLSGHQPISDFHYSPFEIRSLPYATLAWGKALFGGEMLHYRLENLLLHFAVTCALYWFVWTLAARLSLAQEKAMSGQAMAFFAALLFALHPVAVYGAGYLIQRTIVMATLFSLLAMLAWLRDDGPSAARWGWVAVGFYYLAVFSKEHAVMLPAVLVSLTILLHAQDWRERLTARLPQCLTLAGIAAWVVLAQRGVLGGVYEIYAPEMLADADNALNWPLSVLTQSWLFFKYALLWLLPNPDWMSVDMREPFAPSLWSGYLAAFCAFLTWGGLAVWLLFKRGHWGLLGFALLFPWLMFMTEFSTVRIQESFVLYRSYLWAVGAGAALPLLVSRVDKKLAVAVLAGMALAFFPISMDRLASFAHPLLLWDDAAKLVKHRPELPGVYRIYYNRGTERLKVDDYTGAIEDLQLAVQLHPEWPYPYVNLGVGYTKIGDFGRAVEAYSRAIELAERKQMGFNPKPYLGRAIAYIQTDRIELARKDYRISCERSGLGCDRLQALSKHKDSISPKVSPAPADK